MSVINKMLRDLDQRQGGHVVNTGYVSVPQRRTGNAPSSTWRMRQVGGVVAAVVLAGGLGAAVWRPWSAPPAEIAAKPPTLVAAPMPTVIASEPMAAAAPLPVASTLASATLVVASKPTPEVSAATPAPALVAASPSPVVSLRMEPMLSARKAPDAVLSGSAAVVPVHPNKAAAASNTPVTDAAPTGQRQQQASADALQQAQTLWNAGSHAAAIDLMQQSVDAAERAVKSGNSAVGNPALLAVVRELVRMQMAQARFGAVWELLSRLEPVLGSAPDLWALRANTAQRLGHHQDSVNAYRAALQSTPGEQRWLLGSAVSMAALGQTSQAAEMAEKARSVGEISREVQAYLRQMGVPLKDK